MPNWSKPGDTTRNGYGAAHQRTRRSWAPLVRAGTVDCAECGERIRPGQPWDLGHVPGSGKQLYRGPEHRDCNRDTADERGPKDPKPTPRTKW